MKKYLLLAVFLCFMSGIVTACQSNDPTMDELVGRYVTGYPDEYLELHADGTHSLREYATNFTGTWKVEGDTLTITIDSTPGFFATATIKGDTLYDRTADKTWVREE